MFDARLYMLTTAFGLELNDGKCLSSRGTERAFVKCGGIPMFVVVVVEGKNQV